MFIMMKDVWQRLNALTTLWNTEAELAQRGV